MLRRKSTSKGGRSSVTSFMKLSPTTKNAVAASMAAMPLRSELLSMDAVYINVQGAKNTAMDTIADDGLCRTAGRGVRRRSRCELRRALATPLVALKYPLFSGHARSAPEGPVLDVSKDDPKQTGACQRAKAPETGHREGRSWVDFGRKPGVPSVRL